jgi:hypothetical protein
MRNVSLFVRSCSKLVGFRPFLSGLATETTWNVAFPARHGSMLVHPGPERTRNVAFLMGRGSFLRRNVAFPVRHGSKPRGNGSGRDDHGAFLVRFEREPFRHGSFLSRFDPFPARSDRELWPRVTEAAGFVVFVQKSHRMWFRFEPPPWPLVLNLPASRRFLGISSKVVPCKTEEVAFT